MCSLGEKMELLKQHIGPIDLMLILSIGKLFINDNSQCLFWLEFNFLYLKNCLCQLIIPELRKHVIMQTPPKIQMSATISNKNVWLLINAIELKFLP